ncbi:hypothetical protein RsS62_06920 [Rhizobium dioscoreae]|uniref:Uncharacterized protein n=1 Tax=Rhizobium dioscoreae TaxID=2653122 RepID=A0ABQ0Z7Q5_9HYPH|nr:hypothetical protein RsS62_06920 [Rhizobium dioscoreae]GES51505.1 hypothetical protein RsS93_41190 [Rhizobium dioscoreae]GLU82957.1 hypothetical protein Rhsp01_41330 [Rhizobium sp. NBRC 114257]
MSLTPDEQIGNRILVGFETAGNGQFRKLAPGRPISDAQRLTVHPSRWRCSYRCKIGNAPQQTLRIDLWV